MQIASKHYKLILSIACLLVLIFTFYCIQTIPPGNVGVVVNLLSHEKGVEDEYLNTGVYFVAPWKKVYIFPIFEQNDSWEKAESFDFQTSEGMAVCADVGITYHLKPSAIPSIFQKYRRGMSEITHIFIKNHIRDSINKSASHMKIEDLYSSGKELFFDNVEKMVSSELKPIGIEISRIYLIGRFHFPENVIKALNSKIEANQRAQQRENELREAEAEAKKQVAKSEGMAKCAMIQALAEAQANELVARSLTRELIDWQAVQKWNGQLPTSTGSAIPLINLDRR